MMKIKFLLFISFLSSSLCFAASDDAALRLSEGAEITGSTVLLIGFEGLMGFNSSGSKQAVEYQCNLSYGGNGKKPGGFGGQVLKAITVPVIEKYKNQVRVLMYPWGSCSRASCAGPIAMATQWMRDSDKSLNSMGRKVIVVGHSFGGDAAIILGNKLAEKGVKVDSVFSIDPRKQGTGLGGFKKAGSARWVNFYQKKDFLLMGWEVSGAENNYLVPTSFPGHLKLPHHDKILATIMSQIGEPPGPKTVLAKGGETCGTKSTSLFGKWTHNGEKGDPGMGSLGAKPVAGSSGISDAQIPIPERSPREIPVPSKAPRKANNSHPIIPKDNDYANRPTWMDGRPSTPFGNASGASKMGSSSGLAAADQDSKRDPNSNRAVLPANQRNTVNRSTASLSEFSEQGANQEEANKEATNDTSLNSSGFTSTGSNAGRLNPSQNQMGSMVKELIAQSEQKESKEEDNLFLRINKITRRIFAQPK